MNIFYLFPSDMVHIMLAICLMFTCLVAYGVLITDQSPMKAEMSRMSLELTQSLERCRIDANEKIKNEEIRSKSIEVEYNTLRTRYENEKLTQQEREFQYKSQIDQTTRYIKDLEEKYQVLAEGKSSIFVEIARFNRFRRDCNANHLRLRCIILLNF